MSNEEIIKDRRFRFAVQKGEYSRAISLFLRMKFPDNEELYRLPKNEIQNAQVCVDNAFNERFYREKELAQEMR